jgi:hypothetical protein
LLFYDSKQKQLEEPKFSPCKVPKNPLFALEKFLKILIKNYLFKSFFFCHFSSYLFAVLLQQKQIQEEFMLILGGFQGFQGPWGGLTSVFLSCPFPSGSWVSWLVFFA